MSIRKKILIPMLALIGICSAAVLVSSILLYDNDLRDAANNRINVAAAQVEHEISACKSSSYMAAVKMAGNRELKAALKSRNRGEILAVANSLQNMTGVDFCVVLDSEGTVLARTNRPDQYGENLGALSDVKSSLSGKVDTAVGGGPPSVWRCARARRYMMNTTRSRAW
jgi:sensor histidine kinase regulating citrate/malate metabolism